MENKKDIGEVWARMGIYGQKFDLQVLRKEIRMEDSGGTMPPLSNQFNYKYQTLD